MNLEAAGGVMTRTRPTAGAATLAAWALFAVPAAAQPSDLAFEAAIIRAVDEIARSGQEEVLARLHEDLRRQASRCMAEALRDLDPAQKQAVVDYRDAVQMIEELQEMTRETPAYETVGNCFEAARKVMDGE